MMILVALVIFQRQLPDLVRILSQRVAHTALDLRRRVELTNLYFESCRLHLWHYGQFERKTRKGKFIGRGTIRKALGSSEAPQGHRWCYFRQQLPRRRANVE